ncbi:MAG TPA: hypothetical protein VL882_21670 [Vicinamibacterales bacterium]|jgi:hypothetical protein|nr:hypothetical protein [Vicinamibacterales bacterium]
MSATPQLQVLYGRRPTVRKRHHMVEFQKSSFRTPAVTSDKRTTAVVARPNCTTHCGGDVPANALDRSRRRTWTIHFRELPLL